MKTNTLTKEQFFDMLTDSYNFYKHYFDCDFTLEPKLTTGINPEDFTWSDVEYRLYLKLGKKVGEEIDFNYEKIKLHDEIIKENCKQTTQKMTEQYKQWLIEWKELLAKALQGQREKEDLKKKEAEKEFSFDDINFDNEHITINIFYGI